MFFRNKETGEKFALSDTHIADKEGMKRHAEVFDGVRKGKYEIITDWSEILVG